MLNIKYPAQFLLGSAHMQEIKEIHKYLEDDSFDTEFPFVFFWSRDRIQNQEWQSSVSLLVKSLEAASSFHQKMQISEMEYKGNRS